MNLVALVIHHTLALDGAVGDEEGLGLGGALIEEEIALGELDAVHVLRHLLHRVGIVTPKLGLFSCNPQQPPPSSISRTDVKIFERREDQEQRMHEPHEH